MINSIVMETMSSMTPGEIKSFGKFIRSPYFNESPLLIKLFEILKKYYPEFTNRNLTKEKIHTKIFPGKKYNDDMMRKLLSDLQGLFEDFLTQSIFEENPFNKRMLLLERLDNKKLISQFERKLKQVEEEYMSGNEVSQEYFGRGLSVTTKKSDHIIGAGEMGQYNVQKMVLDTQSGRFNYFISDALINMLKIAQDYISLARFYSLDYSSLLVSKFFENFRMKEFIEQYKLHSPQYYPIIMIYYYNYIIQRAGENDYDDEIYHNLKKLVIENMKKFSLHERKIHMLFLENGCLGKIRVGRKDYLKEQHSIYKIMLENNLYIYRESDNMTTSRFLKILQNAIDIKEFDWAENFVRDYSGKLSPDITANMKNYSFARIHLSKGNYDKAVEFASKVKFLTFNLNFQTKILKLKSFYEMKYYDEILYQIDSYKRTLAKDKISPVQAKGKFSHFITFLNKIIRVQLSGNNDRHEINLISNDVARTADIYEKPWLEDKLSQLK